MNSNTQSKKDYPAVYEKLIPVAIGLLVVIISGMSILTIAVALGWVGN